MRKLTGDWMTKLMPVGREVGRRTVGALLLAVVFGTTGAFAQIVVGQVASGHNQLGDAAPQSGDMRNGGDLKVTFDIEIGGELYLNETIFMRRTGGNADQRIYFADAGSRTSADRKSAGQGRRLVTLWRNDSGTWSSD